MAGMGRSQGSRFGLAALAGAIGVLLGFSGNRHTADRLRSGNTQGFPLAKKYVRTLNAEKAITCRSRYSTNRNVLAGTKAASRRASANA
jgi:hypothetical protein